MKHNFKRIISIVSIVALCFCITGIGDMKVHAANTITKNNSRTAAYNYGRWSAINSNYATVILEKNQRESWLAFTLDPNEHIYIRTSYSSEYEGEWYEIQDGLGNTIGAPQYTPGNVHDIGTATPDIFLNCDNNSTSTRTYYLILHRGSVPTDTDIYFSVSAYNRIETAIGKCSVSGTASNPGSGNSSIITVNLTNNSSFPNGAIVTRIESSGTQSPNQGNVRHMIMPASNNVWYTSTVSSATSGSYAISISNNIPVKQLWSFRYNAPATAKSTMKSVSLRITFQYDLSETGYKRVISF
ncbi:hypothetical protein EDD76_11939 [Kineothrix alysoides]|uniref:Uncharacterized protein n=1 Tax=Kineothrix alysoides TaxID=1469948 RepID=A0A4R1QLU7_9FIRM|nr:hypothetical protein [Kineothrix alysoides]TCL54616.1 hypothetical protein EDD76_11939 [Kineothrix alysoides]